MKQRLPVSSLVHGFLTLWLVYFVALMAIAAVSVLAIVPAFLYARFGVIELIPPPELLLKVGKMVVAGSFALTVVMWGWSVIKTRSSQGERRPS
jgi:hypothetical protein